MGWGTPTELQSRPVHLDVEKLDLSPGDVVLVRSRERLSPEILEAIVEAAARKLPDQRVLVVDGAFSVSALGPDSLQSQWSDDGESVVVYARGASAQMIREEVPLVAPRPLGHEGA